MWDVIQREFIQSVHDINRGFWCTAQMQMSNQISKYSRCRIIVDKMRPTICT